MAEKDRPGARVATVHAVATAKFRLWVLESRECREPSRGSDYAGVVRRENRDGAAAVDGTSAGRFKKRLAFPPRLLRRRSCSLELPAYKMGPDIYETMSSSPLALAPFAVPALRETMSLSAVTTREALLFPAPGGSCSLLPGFHRLCLRACLVLAEPARALMTVREEGIGERGGQGSSCRSRFRLKRVPLLVAASARRPSPSCRKSLCSVPVRSAVFARVSSPLLLALLWFGSRQALSRTRCRRCVARAHGRSA